MDKPISKLNDLIALDIDASHAYEAAIKRITAPDLKRHLRDFQRDHERHIQNLSNCVMRSGATPRKRADFKGFFLESFTAVTSMMGNEAALIAMRGNESLSNRAYQSALSENWQPEVRAVIEKNYADEQRHMAFIHEALRTRSWAEPEQPSQQP